MEDDHPKSDISVYYNRGREQARLIQSTGRLEFARTQELILRYLQQPPAVILKP